MDCRTHSLSDDDSDDMLVQMLEAFALDRACARSFPNSHLLATQNYFLSNANYAHVLRVEEVVDVTSNPLSTHLTSSSFFFVAPPCRCHVLASRHSQSSHVAWSEDPPGNIPLTTEPGNTTASETARTRGIGERVPRLRACLAEYAHTTLGLHLPRICAPGSVLDYGQRWVLTRDPPETFVRDAARSPTTSRAHGGYRCAPRIKTI
eukprot:scaffold973_cov399-Prasinococcus_capsulatus_cf.AAC.17